VVRRYGQVIGFATQPIAAGDHVHSHNLDIGELAADRYEIGVDVIPVQRHPPEAMRFFDGYRRGDGRVGTRNYVAVISGVNCSASVSQFVKDRFRDVSKDHPNIDGVLAITHKSGCGSKLFGEDHLALQRVLAETPEIYGAEHLLIRRAIDEGVAKKLLDRYKWWEWYCRGLEAMDNNPAPGNKAGGITTVFEKSLGGVTKGGTTPLMDVFLYGEPITTRGFVFMDTPGHDPVSITGLVAGGCNVICFTTGRGSVFGCKPVPSIKLATNSLMYRHLEEDMDVNCGVILEGTPLPTVGRQIFEEIIAVASGKRTKSELSGVGEEEFAPWIIGPVM
jgi:altronate dehydratase